MRGPAISPNFSPSTSPSLDEAFYRLWTFPPGHMTSQVTTLPCCDMTLNGWVWSGSLTQSCLSRDKCGYPQLAYQMIGELYTCTCTSTHVLRVQIYFCTCSFRVNFTPTESDLAGVKTQFDGDFTVRKWDFKNSERKLFFYFSRFQLILQSHPLPMSLMIG